MLLTGVIDMLKRFTPKEQGGGQGDVPALLQQWIEQNKENVKVRTVCCVCVCV